MFNLFKKSDKGDFKFKEPGNTACFSCDHVLKKERPILYVSHDEDDESWQFLCGLDDHTQANIKIVSLKNATELDSTINDLYEMPVGYEAERRTINDKWSPFKKQD
jgi:hypothetical protein